MENEEIKPGYIRVSQILSQWDTFGHIDPEVLNAKCAIGDSVHKAIEAHFNGQMVALSPKAEPYLASFFQWYEGTAPELIKAEERFYCSKLGITGKIDGIFKVRGCDKPLIIDYKTSAMESPKTWPLQAVFYHYLSTINGENVGDKIVFLKLDKDGKTPKAYEYHYTPALMTIAVSALNCYKWRTSP